MTSLDPRSGARRGAARRTRSAGRPLPVERDGPQEQPDDRPVARLTSPGQLAAAVPLLCGFLPERSLVVLSLKGPRGRVGLTMRFDLPPPQHEPAFVAEVLARLRVDGATRAGLVLYDDAAGEDLPRRRLVLALVGALQDGGVGVREALHVRDGTWWSYTCGSTCCPVEGSPVTGDAPPVDLLAAEQVLSGRAVLPRRADLVASLAVVAPLGEGVLLEQLDLAADAWAQQGSLLGGPGRRRAALQQWDAALHEAVDLRALPSGPTAAALVVSLSDVLVRDGVVSHVLEQPEALQGLLAALCRVAVPPHAAPVCAALAWAAYAEGQGALAEVALDRALADDPTYGLALLLREALTQQAPPRLLRRVLVRARADLRRPA